jgi:uncharacterized protein with NRDE domain
VCTLIAIHRSVQGAPLIVAANRDEYYDRPAEGPAFRVVGGRRVLAPIDLRAGGTWLGLNEEKVFAAVTNLRNDEPDPQRRSRGMVVMDALREPTAARAADMLKALPEEAYNPFHCFVADREQAFHLVYRDVPKLQVLAPGVHVIGNVDPREEPAPKADRVREQVLQGIPGHRGAGERREQTPADVLRELAAVCSEHGTGGGGVGDTCVHLGAYGTRSSVLLALGDDEEASRLLYADGAPCDSEYEDHSTLLLELSRRARDEKRETGTRNHS